MNPWMVESFLSETCSWRLRRLLHQYSRAPGTPGKAGIQGFENFRSDVSLAGLGCGILLHTKCQIVNADLYAIVEDIICVQY